jgi:hypothetical protein
VTIRALALEDRTIIDCRPVGWRVQTGHGIE